MKPDTQIFNSYIGILLPGEVKEKLRSIDNKFVPKNPHITLYFLGNLKYIELENIHKITKDNLVALFDKKLKINGSNKFTTSNGETLYLKVELPQFLQEARNELKSKLSVYNRERKKYKPHITLLRSGNNIKVPSQIKSFNYEFNIEKIALIGRNKTGNGLSEQKIIFNYS